MARNTWQQFPFLQFNCRIAGLRIGSICTAIGLIAGVASHAYAADAKTAKQGHVLTKPDAKGTSATEELTLDDVQDVGIMLRHIRQQAVNIYEEAARVKVGINGSSRIVDVSTIPYKFDEAGVLPARQEWLVIFVGTMEPLIRQLALHVSEVEKGTKEVMVPGEILQSLEVLWAKWTKGVISLNSHLSELVPMIDDAPHNNARIRQCAVSLFEDVARLESIRESIFKLIRETEKKHPDAKIMVTPES